MTDGDRDDGGRAEGGEAETVLPLWPQREGPAPTGVGGIVSATPPPFRHESLAERSIDRLGMTGEDGAETEASVEPLWADCIPRDEDPLRPDLTGRSLDSTGSTTDEVA